MLNEAVRLETVKLLFRNVIDKLYDAIELQISDATLPYKQFCDSAGILFEQTLLEVHMEPIAAAPSPSKATQFPGPHAIFTPRKKPSRCSANTLAGLRCRDGAFLPFTLCATQWRYFRRHRAFPLVGSLNPN